MRRGMNERIQKLREQSVNAVPHIYMALSVYRR